MNALRLTVNGAQTSIDTAIEVLSGALDLVSGDLLLVETAEDVGYTAEILEVNGDPTVDTAFTAIRGASGTTAAAIADTTKITRIGSAFEEGSTSPKAATRNPTKLFNYAQIQKTSYNITNTAAATRARTGDPIKNDKKRRMFDHAVKTEFQLLFGKRFENTSGTEIKRFSGGVLYFLAAQGGTSVKIYSGTPTEDNVLDDSYKMFDYTVDGGTGGNQRIGLCGNGFLNSLNKLARNSASTRVNYEDTVKFYGMELQKWILPQGSLLLRTHPLMNTHGRYTNSVFWLNPGGFVYRPLKGRDTKMDEGAGGRGIQANDADQKKGQWIQEVGMEVHHLKTMAYWGNFIV